jgi:hypothetical protein
LLDAPPPPPLGAGVVAGFCALVSLLEELLLLSLPQPATARAARAEQSATDGTIGFMMRASGGWCERVAQLVLRMPSESGSAR